MRIIFKCQRLSLKELLSICLIFCQLQPCVAYKSVANKITCNGKIGEMKKVILLNINICKGLFFI